MDDEGTDRHEPRVTVNGRPRKFTDRREKTPSILRGLVWVRDQSLTDPALSVRGRRDLTRVSVCVWRRVAHAVSNQRLLALDDVSLNPSVVVPPLPEREADKTLLNTDDCDAELHLHRMDL